MYARDLNNKTQYKISNKIIVLMAEVQNGEKKPSTIMIIKMSSLTL